MTTLRERFMDKVAMTETCWLWQGATNTGGGGQKYGVIGHGRSNAPASYVSWRLHRGFLPDNAKISHMCGQTLCVRPDHLKASVTDEDRFYDMVHVTDTCWLWVGAIDSNGYGKFGVEGGTVLAHRFSWGLFNGPIPKGKHILHNCPDADSTSCVNPGHLRIGTHVENMADGAKKGQHVRGEQQPAARLTEAQVLAIRERFDNRQMVTTRTNRNGKDSLGAIAKDYGVGVGTIYDIVKRKTWRHI